MSKSFTVTYIYSDEKYMYFEDTTNTIETYNNEIYKRFEHIAEHTAADKVQYYSPLKFGTKTFRIKIKPNADANANNLIQLQNYIMSCKFVSRNFKIEEQQMFGWMIQTPRFTIVEPKK